MFHLCAILMHSNTVARVNTTDQLVELQENHPVLFILVENGEIDRDWHSLYWRLAQEMTLLGKFVFTLDPNIVKVGSNEFKQIGSLQFTFKTSQIFWLNIWLSLFLGMTCLYCAI